MLKNLSHFLLGILSALIVSPALAADQIAFNYPPFEVLHFPKRHQSFSQQEFEAHNAKCSVLRIFAQARKLRIHFLL